MKPQLHEDPRDDVQFQEEEEEQHKEKEWDALLRTETTVIPDNMKKAVSEKQESFKNFGVMGVE